MTGKLGWTTKEKIIKYNRNALNLVDAHVILIKDNEAIIANMHSGIQWGMNHWL